MENSVETLKKMVDDEGYAVVNAIDDYVLELLKREGYLVHVIDHHPFLNESYRVLTSSETTYSQAYGYVDRTYTRGNNMENGAVSDIAEVRELRPPQNNRPYNWTLYMSDQKKSYEPSDATEDVNRMVKTVNRFTKGSLSKVCITVVACKAINLVGKIVLAKIASKK